MLSKQSVVILAAGQSSRMGIPKFSLKYDKDSSFLEHIIQGYEAFGCIEIIVVLNEKNMKLLEKNTFGFSDRVQIIINHKPEWERFYSLKLALSRMDAKNAVFAHNVDNPFVNQAVLKLLSDNISDNNFVVPEYRGKGGHPVLLSEKVVEAIVAEKKNDLNLKVFLKDYKKELIKVDDERILVNINAKEEYDAFNLNNSQKPLIRRKSDTVC